MTLTRDIVAERIAAYLHHRLRLEELVDWAENAVMDEEFAESDAELLASVVARIGVADVRAFGLTWDDCEDLLRRLGYTARVEVVVA
jgi:hypothetical protein